jgi:hypothetical protein
MGRSRLQNVVLYVACSVFGVQVSGLNTETRNLTPWLVQGFCNSLEGVPR